MVAIEENKDNEKQHRNNALPSLNGEQEDEDSSTTPEAVIDDGHEQEQEQQRQQEDVDTVVAIEENKDNEKTA